MQIIALPGSHNEFVDGKLTEFSHISLVHVHDTTRRLNTVVRINFVKMNSFWTTECVVIPRCSNDLGYVCINEFYFMDELERCRFCWSLPFLIWLLKPVLIDAYEGNMAWCLANHERVRFKSYWNGVDAAFHTELTDYFERFRIDAD